MPKIEDFIRQIQGAVNRDDRRFLAALRRGMSITTQEQAWPLVVPWCADFEDEAKRKIWCLVGGAAALLLPANLGTTEAVSLGRVMAQIVRGNQTCRVVDQEAALQEEKDQAPKEKGIASYETRFRRILNSPSSCDLCDLVVGVIRTAERHSVQVNLIDLLYDLLSWDDATKREAIRLRWAQDFYQLVEHLSTPTEVEVEEQRQ